MGLFTKKKSTTKEDNGKDVAAPTTEEKTEAEEKKKESTESSSTQSTESPSSPQSTESPPGGMTKKDVVALLKAEAKEKAVPKVWIAFTALTILLLALTGVSWLWFVAKVLYGVARNWRTVLKVVLVAAKVLFVVLKNVVMPVVCILGNAWLFRGAFVRAAVRLAKEKKGFLLRELKIDANAKLLKDRHLDLAVSNVGLKNDGDADEMLAFDVLSVDVNQKDKSKLFFDVDVVLDGLAVNLVTYNFPQFTDTNLSRFLAKLSEGDKDDDDKDDDKKDDKKDDDKKDDDSNKKQGPERVHVTARLKNVRICAKSVGKMMGTRQLGAPITIDDEEIDTEMLKSKTKMVAWLNGFIIRQVTSGAFNIGTSAVDGAGMLVNGVTDKLLGGVDSVADKVPGGSMIKGGTGAVRNVVGGTLGGVSKVTKGVAGGGKAIVGGITSGSVSGVKEGFQKAGAEVGGGLVDGAKSVGGGVAGAGGSLAGGVKNAAAGGSSSSKKRSQSTPPSSKSLREESKEEDAATSKDDTGTPSSSKKPTTKKKSFFSSPFKSSSSKKLTK